MKILKILGIVVLVLVVLFFGIAFFLPSQVHVERSIIIPASSEIVFNQVNDLRSWRNWAPWQQMDPNMEITYEGFLSGEGASYSWESKKVGSGKLTITESRPYKYIATDIEFDKQGTATNYYRFESIDGGTKVVWAFETELGKNPVSKYMGLFMDPIVGNDFEKGLQNLKAHVVALSSDVMTEKNSSK
ncbi:MAG TPA: SRPBCC family protein [Balneolaceae bacterium]|nr:SRPBCC family protein [Balneolaceae bacterium]